MVGAGPTPSSVAGQESTSLDGSTGMGVYPSRTLESTVSLSKCCVCSRSGGCLVSTEIWDLYLCGWERLWTCDRCPPMLPARRMTRSVWLTATMNHVPRFQAVLCTLTNLHSSDPVYNSWQPLPVFLSSCLSPPCWSFHHRSSFSSFHSFN